MEPGKTGETPPKERLEDLERKVARLEKALGLLQERQRSEQERKKEIERRRLLENLPLTALIVVLAVLAAQWVWHILGL